MNMPLARAGDDLGVGVALDGLDLLALAQLEIRRCRRRSACRCCRRRRSPVLPGLGRGRLRRHVEAHDEPVLAGPVDVVLLAVLAHQHEGFAVADVAARVDEHAARACRTVISAYLWPSTASIVSPLRSETPAGSPAATSVPERSRFGRRLREHGLERGLVRVVGACVSDPRGDGVAVLGRENLDRHVRPVDRQMSTAGLRALIRRSTTFEVAYLRHLRPAFLLHGQRDGALRRSPWRGSRRCAGASPPLPTLYRALDRAAALAGRQLDLDAERAAADGQRPEVDRHRAVRAARGAHRADQAVRRPCGRRGRPARSTTSPPAASTAGVRSASVTGVVSAWLPATSSARTLTVPLATANVPAAGTACHAPPLTL